MLTELTSTNAPDKLARIVSSIRLGKAAPLTTPGEGEQPDCSFDANREGMQSPLDWIFAN